MRALPVGRAVLRREGRSGLALLGFGALVPAAERLAPGFDATVVNMRFVKPLDEEMVVEVARRHRAIVTLEENAVAGGAGSAVLECLQAHGLETPVLQVGIPDRFIQHGSRGENLADAGLDDPSLRAAVERFWSRHGLTRAVPAGA
jgi:1-deoxy-D-xylulose-5-phosphate synthase